MPSDLAILTVQRGTDLDAVRREAEAAIGAGQAVNVIVSSGGARSLLVRAVPRAGGVLLSTPTGSATAAPGQVFAALRRHLARAHELLDAKQYEGRL